MHLPMLFCDYFVKINFLRNIYFKPQTNQIFINTQSRLATQAVSGNALDRSMLMIDVAQFSHDQVKLNSE